MEHLYGFHCTAGYFEQSSTAPPLPRTGYQDFASDRVISSNWTPLPAPDQIVRSGSFSSAISDAMSSAMVDVKRMEGGLEEEVSKTFRAKIASHPLYTKLLDAYIDCQKVGAPPETAKLLDEIRREGSGLFQGSASLGADPELDDFMEMYCDLLVKYKSDLSRLFDEATAFLINMETQLNSLCNGPSRNFISDEATGSPKEEFSKEGKEAEEYKRINEDQELKDKLLRRYSGYIRSLKHEFSKTKKKEKLPKEARQILLAWWNIHFKWPYPTEADKVALAEWTGLDQKQINNWFINQRKRYWKPTEEMQTAVLDGLYGPFCLSD